MTTTDPAPRAVEGLLHTIAEQHAVGQAGQRVVQRLMAQVVFECLAFGDVVRVDDDAVHRGIGREVGHREIECAPFAAATGHAQLGSMRGRRIGRQAEQQRGQREPIVGMYEARQLVADQFVGLVAEYSHDRRADVVDEAVVVDDGDDVGSVLDQPAEARLARRQLQLGCLAIVDLASSDHDAVDLGIAAQVGHHDLEPDTCVPSVDASRISRGAGFVAAVAISSLN